MDIIKEIPIVMICFIFNLLFDLTPKASLLDFFEDNAALKSLKSLRSLRALRPLRMISRNETLKVDKEKEKNNKFKKN